MTQKRLVSPDGRRAIVATGEDEINALEDAGYVVPSARRRKAERANSGLEGQLKARASSTTEGQERLTGSTTLENAPEDPFGDDDEAAEDDSNDDDTEDGDAAAEKAAADRVAAQAAARRTATTRPAPKSKTT